jgi:hypothetical protein
MGAFDLDRIKVAPVVIGDHPGDEAAIGVQRVEAARATQHQRLIDPVLHMAMPALDRAVLVRDASIVAGRQHTVMGGQIGEAAGDILGIVGTQVAERRRQTVGAMLGRCAAQERERGGQAGGQRGIALAAEHHLAVFEARVDEREVVQPVFERHAGDRYPKPVHVGEVRQPHPARRMDLPEYDLALGTVRRTPGSDPPLQRTPHAIIDPLRVATCELAQDRDRAQRRRAGEHRHNLLVPQAGQRIGSGAVVARLLAR